MTECERIVSEGILPASFFEEEVVCGFLVTRERKKLHAVLLDLLLEFDRVCRENDLTYYLVYGTLLGSVRHKGCIPWDDDVDVAMMRDDYEKLLNIPGAFHSPFFLQTPYTDEGFFWANATLRNSNTTALTPYFAFQKMNHGAFLDIFVLDDIVDTKEARGIIDKINRLTIDNSTYMRMSNPYLDESQESRVREYKSRIRNPHEIYEEIQDLAQRYRGAGTEYVTSPTATVYGFDRALFLKEDFSGTVEGEYFGYRFPLPVGYDRILRTVYGNYHELPPAETRGCWHNILFDTDTPYREFVSSYRQDLLQSKNTPQ